MERLLRLPAVREFTGKSTSTVYREMSEGRFPKPVKIGERAVAWRQSALEDWLAELTEASAG